MLRPTFHVLACVGLLAMLAGSGRTEVITNNPYDQQIAENVARLASESAAVRAGAVEALGFLRAYAAEDALLDCLRDPVVEVRRQSAMTLAWCGGRKAISHLLESLTRPREAATRSRRTNFRSISSLAVTNSLTGPKPGSKGTCRPKSKNGRVRSGR